MSIVVNNRSVMTFKDGIDLAKWASKVEKIQSKEWGKEIQYGAIADNEKGKKKKKKK